MTLKQIMEHNENVLIKRALLIEKIKRELEQDEYTIISPCEFCKFDGEYRCAACMENAFEGCNIREYPLTEKTNYKKLKEQGLKLWTSL